MREIEILDPGPHALIQDLGRPGNAHLGVPPSGALDTGALRLANRLVGNDESAAGVECLLGGLTLKARVPCTVAVTGPPVDVSDGGSHLPLFLKPGQTLSVGTPATGLRSYLAVSGGLTVEPALGSRSRDVLSAIGPEPLKAGEVLPLGEPGVPCGWDVIRPAVAPPELIVPVTLGPRDDWFDDPAESLAKPWTVTSESNRVGLRFEGKSLRRAGEIAELPSEGLLTGAIQVPPSGLPVLFLADHPTTGGYPVVAVALRSALNALGQVRPGTTVRFRPS
ncbi:biotin-dependent carboxyltransferase family protein [Amycolatopsis sp. cg5]|uniref:5-oxoprolinase subunit C family protein n=1 Tax=Amycolatopsis sp. cg5 TaxID=3238802 RepID=UPI0035243E71